MSRECAKCGNTDIYVRWAAKGEELLGIRFDPRRNDPPDGIVIEYSHFHAARELLTARCRGCGWWWTEPPRDAAAPPTSSQGGAGI